MRSASEVMIALDEASEGVQSASTELSKVSQEFYGARVDEHGQEQLGLGLAFDVALKEAITDIYTEAIEQNRRPPAEDIRAAMAFKRIRRNQPKLWIDYHGRKARIEALKMWISNQKAAISANQSVLRGERE